MNALRCSVARPANHFYRRIARFAAMSADPKELLGYQERNRGPILDVLRGYLADIEPGMLVEVACGNGAHAAYFAPEFPHISWFPTDITEDRFPSVKAYASEVENMQKPVVLDCSRPVEDWACGSPGNTAAVLAINLLHISPWEASIGLIKGSSVLLRPKGLLLVYGPFKRDGQFTTESNAEFDANLKQRNPSWGYRDIEDVNALTKDVGLDLERVHEMPANNFMLVFRKRS